MSLAGLTKQKNWTELQETWTRDALEGAGIEDALEAVAVAARAKELARILPCVRDHADMLVAGERPAEAARLLGTTLLAGGSPGELARPLVEAATEAWSDHPGWESFTRISGFAAGVADIRSAWRTLERLLGLEEGRIVYHAKGWGLGRIEGVDLAAEEVRVRFQSGRSDRFPLTSAAEIFEVLAEGDLRALVVLDPAELARRLKEDPLGVLRWVCARNGGRANHATIKLALKTLGVEGPRFTTFWRRAQKAAEESPWFELSGPPTRRVVRLLDTAEDPAESLRRQLLRSRDLGEALTRVRSIVAGEGGDAAMREAALASLEELVAAGEQDLSQRLAVWIFLREARGATPAALREHLEACLREPRPANPSQPPALWRTFGRVRTRRDQERCLELLRELLPDTWLEEAAQDLPHAPPGMVRGLVEELERAGRHADLVRHYAALLARPTRNPRLLVRLAAAIENGRDTSGLIAPAQRAQSLLQLAVHLHRATSNDPEAVRARTRLSSLLTGGSPPLLRRLLADAGPDTIRGLVSMLEAGVERAVDRLFTQIAIEVSPNAFRGDERPFWETGGVWTTRAGLARKQEELRLLRDVKIPANAEAIGKAASHGDLSENSEWEAAIEEQRNLTQRAMELEEAIRTAHVLDDAVLPDDTVAPGTRVRVALGDPPEEREFDVLGPWDADGETALSYRSPLVAGLLGHHAGETLSVELPGGTTLVRILSIGRADLSRSRVDVS